MKPNSILGSYLFKQAILNFLFVLTVISAVIMMFDMNGLKGPNTWGKDIYGINIFTDGKITPIGTGWDLEDLKKDCSETGTGISCSHYYRIGGEFNE